MGERVRMKGCRVNVTRKKSDKWQELWAHQDFLRVPIELHLSKGKLPVKDRTNLERLGRWVGKPALSEQRVRGALPQVGGCGGSEPGLGVNSGTPNRERCKGSD